MQGVVFARVDFFLRQLVVGDGIEPFYPCGYVAISDALHFQFVHLNKVSDLFEAEGGVVHQPDGGGLGHKRFCHVMLLCAYLSRRLNGVPGDPFPGPGWVSVVGELRGDIVG